MKFNLSSLFVFATAMLAVNTLPIIPDQHSDNPSLAITQPRAENLVARDIFPGPNRSIRGRVKGLFKTKKATSWVPKKEDLYPNKKNFNKAIKAIKEQTEKAMKMIKAEKDKAMKAYRAEKAKKEKAKKDKAEKARKEKERKEKAKKAKKAKMEKKNKNSSGGFMSGTFQKIKETGQKLSPF